MLLESFLLPEAPGSSQKGLPEPQFVPIGLHYSDSQTVPGACGGRHRACDGVPPHPRSSADDEVVQDLVTTVHGWAMLQPEAIGAELQRASLSKTTWRERTLIWKGRSLAYAERVRITDE